MIFICRYLYDVRVDVWIRCLRIETVEHIKKYKNRKKTT